jgi:hypothetical protein
MTALDGIAEESQEPEACQGLDAYHDDDVNANGTENEIESENGAVIMVERTGGIDQSDLKIKARI